MYNSDIICVYFITATHSDFILVRINFFNTEEGYDFLLIGEGDNSADRSSILATLTGNPKLQALTSSNSKLWLTFTTDSSVETHGYELEIKRLAVDLINGRTNI